MNHKNQHKDSGGCGTETGLISVDEALNLIQMYTQTLQSETLQLKDALHRYLSAPIYSNVELPIFSQSAVDGYALATDQSVIRQGATFNVVGEIRAGQNDELQLKAGHALRIFTGAKLPQNTQTVARQEIVEVKGNSVVMLSDLKLNSDIRDQGEEIAQGQCLAERGQQLHVGAIASLSMAGIHQVEVIQYPKIAVVITGDEVAHTAEDLNDGKIFDANGPLLQAWFNAQHQQVKIVHVEDNESALSSLFETLTQEHDVIITTGGVSVGDYDFVRPVASSLGFEQIFWKVKQKPGKPMLFAQCHRKNKTPCYLLGLPGNPAAVYVAMQVYGTALLNGLQGQIDAFKWFTAILKHTISADSRERFLRMRLELDGAQLIVEQLPNQQSHMMNNLMQANCIVRIPADQNLEAGETVKGLMI